MGAEPDGDRHPTQSPGRGRRLLLARVAISAVFGLLAVVVVGIVGLAFLEPCPISETGGGAPCFRQASWVGIAEAVAAVVSAAFAWWISGLLSASSGGPRDADRRRRR